MENRKSLVQYDDYETYGDYGIYEDYETYENYDFYKFAEIDPFVQITTCFCAYREKGDCNAFLRLQCFFAIAILLWKKAIAMLEIK